LVSQIGIMPGLFTGKGSIDVAAAVLAHPYAVEVLGREGVTGPQQRNAVKTRRR
jgi:hypothetical protein